SSQTALGQLRIIVAMNQVMNDTGMVCVLFPELFQDRGCLTLFRQTCVVRRGITDRQDRERVEGLHFEIVRILVAELAHRLFVGKHPIARSDWSVTRLSNGASARTTRCVVIGIKRGDESPFA